MWELDPKESWAPKNWCLQTVVREKTLESPLDSKEIKQSILQEINRNIHWKDWRCSSNSWPHDEKSQLIWKDPDAGKDWRQKDKEAAEDEMVR